MAVAPAPLRSRINSLRIGLDRINDALRRGAPNSVRVDPRGGINYRALHQWCADNAATALGLLEPLREHAQQLLTTVNALIAERDTTVAALELALRQRRATDDAVALATQQLGAALRTSADHQRALREVTRQRDELAQKVNDFTQALQTSMRAHEASETARRDAHRAAEARHTELMNAAADLLAEREEARKAVADRDRKLATLSAQLDKANQPAPSANSALTGDAGALVDELRTRLAEAIENGGRCDGAAADLADRLRRAEATAADQAAIVDQLRGRLDSQSTASWLVPSITAVLGVLLGNRRRSA